MTLAVLLFVGISCATSPSPLAVAAMVPQSVQQTTPADKAPTTASPQNPDAAPQNPPTAEKPSATTAPAQPSSEQKPATAPKPRRHKKKIVEAGCDRAPGTTAGVTPSANAPPNTAAGSPPTADPQKKKCPPPPKIVVRQGSTAEPSIRLAGGAGGVQAADERDTVSRMLEGTEANLKKLTGQQLTQNQQDMVNQIRQFVGESRTAVAAGDLDRGRTLAWKAQLLSEELVKPPEK